MSTAVTHNSMYVGPATTVTVPAAGQAGVWGPVGTAVPYNLAVANAGPDPSPTTAWTGGRYIVLGDGSRAYWNGAGPGFVAGVAP
jgi:hypothetical protein